MTRQEWIACLAALTTPHDPPKATSAMMRYLPFLADLPDTAFTAASVEHVAMQPRRLAIPDLAEVKRPLSEWWRDNRPSAPRIALQATEGPRPAYRATPDEQNAVSGLLSAFTGHVAQKPHMAQRQNVIAPEVLAEIRAKREKTG